ncbi:related to thiol methyltransferase [Cephalotrichum gorgonifer]|uniref:Related to thiol methyltransferase n=1 Tax=Cephalotrichum gorgonifer TaxID=2041049 RepID=A0AAE8MRP0_9PEZI|nr:related to thiol methyltransferase [Cephalotrichum gorgonifer]
MAAGSQEVQNLFKGLPTQNHGSAWEQLWTTSLTPWDRSGPSPPLADLLSSRPDLFPLPRGGEEGRRRTALVPGCGRGHDVLLLASFGYDAVGLDLAETAIREARANEEAAAADETRYPLAEGVVERGRVTWVAGDFFSDAFLREAGVDSFDIIFDYTFSCALPMSLRPKWAARMSRLLSPAATGRLVILQFPNGKSLSLPGPPWGVNSDMYLALLSRPGEEIPCDDDGNVPGADRIERTADGLRRLELIVPTRTHTIGVAADGTITDRVSVWSH